MWKLDCAPKIKHLLWSLAHNSLAVRKNICRWILIPDVLYAGDLTKMAGKLFEVQVCEEMLERTKFGAYSATICGSGIDPPPDSSFSTLGIVRLWHGLPKFAPL